MLNAAPAQLRLRIRAHCFAVARTGALVKSVAKQGYKAAKASVKNSLEE